MVRGITGITAFLHNGYIYGLHAHRDGSSVAFDFSILRLRFSNPIWFYFPLGLEEEIQAVWICHRGRGKSYTFTVSDF